MCHNLKNKTDRPFLSSQVNSRNFHGAESRNNIPSLILTSIKSPFRFVVDANPPSSSHCPTWECIAVRSFPASRAWNSSRIYLGRTVEGRGGETRRQRPKHPSSRCPRVIFYVLRERATSLSDRWRRQRWCVGPRGRSGRWSFLRV